MKTKQVTAAIALAGFIAAAFSAAGSPVRAEELHVANDVTAMSTIHETVDSGETLSSIASSYQTNFKRLYDANHHITDPNVIRAGWNIRIPTADEQLQPRPLPSEIAQAQIQVQAAAPSVSPALAPTPAASKPAATSVRPASSAVGGSVWDKLAQCEASGNWAINTGNGYYGGLQFTLSSWRGVGGTGYPHQHSREQQIAMGERLLAKQGWGAWPACSAKLGLR